MSFAARQHTPGGAEAPPTGPQPLGGMYIGGATPSSSARTASITINPNGTISSTNGMSDPAVTTLPANWYLPTTTAVGAGYRVRFSLQSGNDWSVGLSNGAFYALDTARTLSWTLPPTEQRYAVVLIEITAIGNGTVLSSGTLNIELISDY